MPKDVIVVVNTDAKPIATEELGILIISTNGAKPYKIYRDLDVILEDFGDCPAYRKAVRMFDQGNTLATTLIRKVAMVGFESVTSPEEMLQKIEELRETQDDWYLFMTDRAEDEMMEALAAYAESTEPTEAELGAGAEDNRKLYFAQTGNKEIYESMSKHRRAAVIYSEAPEEEHADAAYVGCVGPFYPVSVTWKFKTPDGMEPGLLTAGEKDALEEYNINFMTTENKRNYMKNGQCLDGDFIDVVLGADYITSYMRDALYELFLANANIPYTDAGFTLVAGAVLKALDRAVELNIIARDPENGQGVYTVMVPSRKEATKEQAHNRQMPDIIWEALLEGAVHGMKTKGVLKAQL